MEKIIIENFGGLKYLEFDFNRINILIGPQASGKSISVKLLFYFKSFFAEIFKCVDNEESKRELDSRHKEKFYSFFPKEAWGKGTFRIQYILNNTVISVERVGTNPLKFEYSDNLVSLINKGRKIHREELRKVENDPRASSYRVTRATRSRFRECIEKEISPIANHTQYFVPAGRSFFANIQSSIFSFLSDNRSLDPFLIEFGSFYENFKRFSANHGPSSKRKRDEFDNLISNVLNGRYIREKDKDFLVHKDSRKVNLSNASSGQQETLPLILVLQTLRNFRFESAGATLYIEEPEAHLFPSAQKTMVQLLARTFNSFNSNFQIIVTTHSPYILSSFNNLIEAGKLINSNIHPAGKIYKVIPEAEILDPVDLIAYSVDSGVREILIDEDTELISQNLLDGVSNEISREFGDLLDLEG